MLVAAWSLYVAGLVITIGAATQTLLTGWGALAALVVGLAVFAIGVVLEVRATRSA